VAIYKRDDSDQQNSILKKLPDNEWKRIVPRLRPISFQREEMVRASNKQIRRVLFPTRGVVALLMPAGRGKEIEVAKVGPEGFVGLPLVLGVDRAPMIALCQENVAAQTLSAADFQEYLEDLPEFRRRVLRYSAVLVIGLAQSAVCGQIHTVEQRCARWLLATQDRLGGDTIPVTQEFSARILGIRRASVSFAYAKFQKAGLIHYRRGALTIQNRRSLEGAACECYHLGRAELTRLLGPRRRR
jgi:CRP-like cAMP-binding protein